MGPISTALFSGGSSGPSFSRAASKVKPTGSARRGGGIPVSSGGKKTLRSLGSSSPPSLCLHLILP